ncbi:alpha-(1,3)-fucosyltransferase C-like isoform X2 [Paramacrobiotus metropolitanus]|uniref:alpha-(1,3)-fucosyltransferase C-like isoform X2 n=1 Tax=Paramacrobiotus metropolitanus TaxID=2943436 RepID=UPI0024463D65|nr:alpha-(1,3)-fucosyltransferase C-like isoform X2 [Paramacrobiotus metropolitanus]
MEPMAQNNSFPATETTFNSMTANNADRQQHILFWTKFFGEELTSASELLQRARSGIMDCPYSNCIVSSDRSRLPQSDAVIFHTRDHLWDNLPPKRWAYQYYVFFFLESPANTWNDLNGLSGFFNLTFTYRLDSDIVSDDYFRWFKPHFLNSSSEIDQILRNKTRLAAIFVSNCYSIPSHRDIYIDNLLKYANIDVYGACGTKKCNASTPEICDRLLANYKFYLAYENSVCKDYVTEKIYRAFSHDAVPVVYGGANYSDLFPPHSFINVLDFANPESLAEYLHFLDNNPSEYRKYFQWRIDPAAARLAVPELSKLSWCKLCTILHQQNRKRKVVSDMRHWWHVKGWCRSPQIQNRHWIKNPVLPVPDY